MAFFPHQTLDPATADPFAILSQLLMHARATVGLQALAMHPPDLVQQRRVVASTLAQRPIPPRVVAAGADALQATHRPHRDGFFVVVDEGEDVCLKAEVNAIAFFKRSCSILSCS
jgi:hypothetical protein